ncbi:hypothetical protein HDE_04167 [Halotydeus destructor]|nr:hypothetical protein HDE_04167 [Halotydeus destructor]
MSDMVLSQVRYLVEQQSAQLYIDACELDLVQNSDEFVQMLVDMFVDYRDRGLEKTAAAILKALAYRRMYRVHQIEPSVLPMDIRGLFKLGSDIYGNRVIWVPFSCYKAIPELVDSIVRLDFWESGTSRLSYSTYHVYADLRDLSWGSISMRLFAR